MIFASTGCESTVSLTALIQTINIKSLMLSLDQILNSITNIPAPRLLKAKYLLTQLELNQISSVKEFPD
jgi:hypothetical protein